MSDTYYEKKKRDGLIFTAHNINDAFDYSAVVDTTTGTHLIEQPDGPSYWSRLSGRYRTASEQKQFIKRGCVDEKLSKLSS